MEKRISDPNEAPDFGPGKYTEQAARSGATVVGARDFLIAVNFNLNTTSTRRANAIAYDVREKGRPMREGGSPVGKPLKDAEGNTIMIPGTLKGTKAIGWFIPEYGVAQVSMNITDIKQTPLHVAFDEVCRAAAARGVRVTGTEIVGLVPRNSLIEAGKYFLRKQQRSTGVSESELLKIAIHSMGLSDLAPFKPEEKVIEYLLEAENKKNRLIDRKRIARTGRRLHLGIRRCAGRRAGHHGRQPLLAQGRVGRPLGGVLRLGRQGAGAHERTAHARG